jgi:hypothetical protein
MLIVLLSVTLAGTIQDAPGGRVRATQPWILAFINAGLARSATFRNLVAKLDASDVVVYVEPKLTRPTLGGYLSHKIVVQGNHRYLRIAIDNRGSENRLVCLLAHELQHAVEVAETPEIRDADSFRRAFARFAVPSGCGEGCYETQRALEVERVVSGELKANRIMTRPK